MTVDKSFLEWLSIVSTKLNDPDKVVICPREDGGVIDVAYLELEGRFVEAHLYCEACGTETWVRNPRPPSEEQRKKVLRYRGEA